MINQDCSQRITVSFIFMLELYRVSVGCMLSLFVPQACGDKICTFRENYEKTDGYNRVALIINSFSLCMFLISYGFELKRENWAIRYLDVDYTVPDNSLKEIIKKVPKLDKQMDRLNLIYYYILIATAGIYTLNIGITAKILYEDYHSMSTISCTVSFSLLVLMKLYNSMSVAKVSIDKDEMRSAFLKEFTSFNVLDSDYVSQKRPREIGP
jgi:hypothetical protein